ncbi:MAG TPA: SAM-dependent methyltransferase [Acidimicrobiales bacterium]|nr:SAM-dependent methyltransferase [Acidimicrobiales bacterium]
MELALYDEEHGFYASGTGRAGRGDGDFLTSPEVGPLFGAVVASALDAWWRELGHPDPFVVVEAGAGAGTLARDVLAASPSCASALRYVMVERSEALRARQATMVPLEPPGWVLGPRVPDADGEPVVQRDSGPMCTSLAELPAQKIVGVVLANELLDNLPFIPMRRAESGWQEVRVGDDDGRLVNFPVPADESLAHQASRFAPDAPVGGWIPLQHTAQRWLTQALATVERGRVVLVDYADTTASMATRPPWEWVRTYRGQARGDDPLTDLGLQDVTCEVALDQLAAVRPPALDRAQADFLAAHGIDMLVAEARQAWSAAAANPGLEALKARSRVAEAAALTDPAGLGAFRVLEWPTPPPT